MCHLKALQKKGLIHREPNMSRAIQLLQDSAMGERPPHTLKLLGRIAAGRRWKRSSMPRNSGFEEWEDPDKKFALQVTGETMIEEHIADGDYVIIQKQEARPRRPDRRRPDDDGEATLKKFFARSTASAWSPPTRR